jgi:hypothetical protein
VFASALVEVAVHTSSLTSTNSKAHVWDWSKFMTVKISVDRVLIRISVLY